MMSPSQTALERFRDNPNPSLLSLNAALWQIVIEQRHTGQLIQQLINLVEKVEKAVQK